MEEEQTVPEENMESGTGEESSLISIIDIERTKETILYSSKGDIHILHQITLGEVVVIMLLSCILIFIILDRIVRR